MADVSPYVAIRQMTLDPATFLTITAPIDCNNVMFFNNSADVHERSDPANPATDVLLSAGVADQLLGPPGEVTPGFPRYKAGAPITTVKPVSGTGPAILKFLM